MDAATPTGGLSDQACNECRRRKGRCDRKIPRCSPCSRFSRQCLYHKNTSRTPLTRRHLTTVEDQLRQAQHQIQCMQRRAQAAEAQLHGGGGPQNPEVAMGGSVETMSFSPFVNGGDSFAHDDNAIGNGLGHPHTASQDLVRESGRPQSAASRASVHNGGQATIAGRTPSTSHSGPDDGHLSDAEDLSWDEQTPQHASIGSAGPGAPEERAGVADGMASLSVEAKGSGYLGAASGAAMLRQLLPADQYRRSLKSGSQRPPTAHSGPPISAHSTHGWVPTPIYDERNIAHIDLDGAIDAYFSLYHISYPIVHEPSFRAQYMQVIPRPSGTSWSALAYIVGALGIFTKATGSDDRDLDLFEAAKANISLDTLESGNVTLVQTLTLMSNYLQKRNKPNSGYNYLGLALHMAMGIGLHKDFASAKIRPLAMETRRRVWWTLQVFAVGAMITFGRPLSWPSHGVEASIPLNIEERDLTHASTSLPPTRDGTTVYSSVIQQARFHLATNSIYTTVINASFSSVDELLELDHRNIEPWRQQWAQHSACVIPSPKYKLSSSIMEWRYRNFRIIMYRPFVIRFALQSSQPNGNSVQLSGALRAAVERCMHEARESINSIHSYWTSGEKNRMSAWYALYFLFQASLIPCVRLRNDPSSADAGDWRTQISAALEVITDMSEVNPASRECKEVILRLCSQYLYQVPRPSQSPGNGGGMLLDPTEESPQTQIDKMYSMMWPGTDVLDFGVNSRFTQDDFDFSFGLGTDL